MKPNTMGTPFAEARRDRITAYIAARPGATFREVVAATELHAGTARHHLNVLKRRGRIAETPYGLTLRYFPGATLPVDWQDQVVLREADLARLHGLVMERPGTVQRLLVDAAEAWGWPRSTTQHRLHRLVQAGLLQVNPPGAAVGLRQKAYWSRRSTLPVVASFPVEVPA